MPTRECVESKLSSARTADWHGWPALQGVKGEILELKQAAVASEEHELANHFWCLGAIVDSRRHFLEGFTEMKNGHFYDGWCALEKAEIALDTLLRHYNPDQDDDKFAVAFIMKQTEKFQSLFPYRMFISPALIVRRESCSICGETRSIENPCGHAKWQLYDGELCVSIVEDLDLLEVSFVTNPVQKYSVVFPKSEDGEEEGSYDYRLVENVCAGLRSPFDDWSIEWTKIRHPHKLYSSHEPQNPCPCESGKTYEECCLKEEGVLRPHAIVRFAIEPPEDLPPIIVREPDSLVRVKTSSDQQKPDGDTGRPVVARL
jgi:SEC-C motif